MIKLSSEAVGSARCERGPQTRLPAGSLSFYDERSQETVNAKGGRCTVVSGDRHCVSLISRPGFKNLRVARAHYVK